MTIDPLIEAQYFFSSRYPERATVYADIDKRSRMVCAERRCRFNLSYGPDPLERLDLLLGTDGMPLLIFIHGGYWRSMDKRSFSYVAQPLTKLGYTLAVLNYPLAPQARLARIVQSIDRALDWLIDYRAIELPAYGPIVLAGHSAGAHLAAYAAAERGISSGISGCLCVSGIFDLRPLANTSLAAQIQLSASETVALSPLLGKPFDGWMILAVGSEETEAFHTQTADMALARRKSALQTQILELQYGNHYTTLTSLGEHDGLLNTLDNLARARPASKLAAL